MLEALKFAPSPILNIKTDFSQHATHETLSIIGIEVLIKGSMGLSFNAENSIFSVVRSYINADTTFNHNRFSACEF